MMKKCKRFFLILSLFNSLWGLTLHYEQKIEAFLNNNLVVVPSIDKIKLYSGKLYVLSIKKGNFWEISTKKERPTELLRKGEGPCELKYPYNFFFLNNKRVLFLNGPSEFYIVEIKNRRCRFIGRIKHKVYYPSQVVPVNEDKILILRNIPPVLEDKVRKINLLYLYDLSTRRVLRRFFDFKIEDRSKLMFLRGEYGEGRMIADGKYIYIVYDQPDFLRIFSIEGRLLSKISTNFSWLKKNKAFIKKIYQGEYVITRIKSTKSSQFWLFKREKENKIYILIRDKKEEKIHFYLGEVDQGRGKIINVEKIKFDTEEKILYFKSYNNKKFVFANDNYLYIFAWK